MLTSNSRFNLAASPYYEQLTIHYTNFNTTANFLKAYSNYKIGGTSLMDVFILNLILTYGNDVVENFVQDVVLPGSVINLKRSLA